jgi:hypothetical protein
MRGPQATIDANKGSVIFDNVPCLAVGGFGAREKKIKGRNSQRYPDYFISSVNTLDEWTRWPDNTPPHTPHGVQPVPSSLLDPFFLSEETNARHHSQ